MKLGRNQWITVGGGILVITCGLVAVHTLELDKARVFLDFASGFGRWVIGFAVLGSAGIKVAGVLRNGKKPEG